MTTLVSLLPLEGNVACMPAMSLLGRLSDGVAGMAVVDPPTWIGAASRWEYVDDTEADRTPLEGVYAALSPVAEEVRRVLVPGGVVTAMGGPVVVTAWDMAAAWSGLRLVADLTVLWDTERPPSKHGPTSLSMSVRWYVKPGRRLREVSTVEVPSNVVVCREVPVVDRVNPTQRPVELFNYLITLLTEPGDLVVDPFCGSGSSLVSAEMCGRRWVGGDIDVHQCAEALRRVRHVELEEAHLQPLAWWVRRKHVPIEE